MEEDELTLRLTPPGQHYSHGTHHHPSSSVINSNGPGHGHGPVAGTLAHSRMVLATSMALACTPSTGTGSTNNGGGAGGAGTGNAISGTTNNHHNHHHYQNDMMIVNNTARLLGRRKSPSALVASAPGFIGTGASMAPAATTTVTMCKEERIPPPYVWATDRRAVVHSLEFLLSHGITTVDGDVVCKRCDGKDTHFVDLQLRFSVLSDFFMKHKYSMHDRAPKVWMVPRLLDCKKCHQTDSVKPVIHEKKRQINWLFLLLTQTLGLCTLDQLKYFCKHTKKHRTGAKDRVLYLTYVGLLMQLDPAGSYL